MGRPTPRRSAAPLEQHVHAVARAKRDEPLRLDGEARLEPETVALRDGGEDQHRFGHGEGRTDTDARTCAEGDVGEAVARSGTLRREALGLEALGVIPELRIAMEQPGY